MSFNVQGSVTVRRLRTGATISLSAKSSLPLQQQLNVDSGTVSPDWSIEANQPITTPHAASSNGSTVYLSEGSWSYNGVVLVFDGSQGTTSDGYVINSSTNEAINRHFAMDTETFALKIIDNIASEINYANDTLEFTVLCTYEGSEYWMTWTTEIIIVQSGATGYNGLLFVSPTNTLDSVTTETNIMAQLFSPTGNVSDFYTVWYRNYVGSDVFREKEADGTTATITVNRDEVNGGDSDGAENKDTGGTLFICQFFLDKGDASPVATAAVSIADTADEFTLLMELSSDNKELAENKPVEITAYIYSNTEQLDVTPYCTDIDWKLSVLNPDLTIKRTETSRTITIDMNDSVDDGDVNVVGDVEFTYKK